MPPIGAWSLVSLKRFRDGVFHRYSMGEDATGRLIYDRSGVVCAFLMSAAFRDGTVAQDWSTFLSYSGRWTLTDPATIVHDLDMCSIAAMIGRPLERYIYWLPDGGLELKTASHLNKDGATSHDELIWRRAE